MNCGVLGNFNFVYKFHVKYFLLLKITNMAVIQTLKSNVQLLNVYNKYQGGSNMKHS